VRGGETVTPYYEHDGVTIYHGDCREILPVLTADLLLTDPPYGIGADSAMSRRGGEQYGRAAAPKKQYASTNWDASPPARWLLEMAISRCKHAILFGGNYFDLGPARCVLVWDKQNGDNAFADCELAWTNLDKPVRIKRHMWNGMLRANQEARFEHPTQKPLDVIKWAINQAPADCGVILDPFMGSGTTLRAAKDLGRKAIGIDREERYCEIAAKRLSQEVLAF
jgi:DNA modification methylase